jgi:hypothetical protein
MKRELSFPPPNSSPLHPLAAAALAVTIFVVDAFTPLDMAVAVLYVVVVLMAANFLDRRGLLLVSAGCLIATVVAYVMAHGLTTTTALGRCVMSVAAIAITAFLALKAIQQAWGCWNRPDCSTLRTTPSSCVVWTT